MNDNFKRKVLYDMLAKITGKERTYAIRMFFCRHKLNVLDHNDFMFYVERQKAKRDIAKGNVKAGN